MGAPKNPFQAIPSWTATLGALAAEGATITAVCPGCGQSRRADLAKMIAAKGALFTLWNQTTRCLTPRCDGRVWFYAARPGAGVWPTKMKNAYPHEVERLVRAWKDSRCAPPKPPRLLPDSGRRTRAALAAHRRGGDRF